MSAAADPERQFTQAVSAAARGDRRALDGVLPRVYDELRAIARRAMAQERQDHTLQATAVVHEAYMRLAGQHKLDPADRAHFFAAAAAMVRRILVDHARARGAAKRGGGEDGGGRERVTLSGVVDEESVEHDEIDVLALDAALGRLNDLSPRTARVVELRFFGGMTVDQAANVLGFSPRTVADEWVFARAWLRRELGGAAGESS